MVNRNNKEQKYVFIKTENCSIANLVILKLNTTDAWISDEFMEKAYTIGIIHSCILCQDKQDADNLEIHRTCEVSII